MLKKVLYLLVLVFNINVLFADALPTLAPVLQKAMPAIVNISAQGMIPDTRPSKNPQDNNPESPMLTPQPPLRKFQSIGSGVIVDPKNGIIITNDHVIRHASLVTVTLNDGRRLKAKIIGGDSETDIAVLKIDAKNLQTLPLANSDNIKVGDFVVAIGNPFGLNNFGNSQSATFGIVSAMQRSDLNIEGVENFIQTDAAINPGNSGGALINIKGELIGINTAILSMYGGNIGIGFAIPINMARDVAQQIIRFGSVHRGLMGIFVQHLSPEIAHALGYESPIKGALVAQVNPGSPAEIAGIKAGDIIVKINNTVITQASQVRNTISLLRVGSTVRLNIKRHGKDIALDAVVTDVKQHEQKLQAQDQFLYGLSLRNFEQDSTTHGHIAGIQVVGAAENSPGWRAGLRPGDVIISANQNPTANIEQLKNLAKQTKHDFLVQVLREQGAMYILIV